MNFLFGDEATIKRATGLVPALSTDMMDLISTWRDIYSGKPAWAENRDWDKTTNFAKVVCQDIAGKACNEFEISTGDDELDAEILHTISAVLPDKVEAALALGAIVPVHITTRTRRASQSTGTRQTASCQSHGTPGSLYPQSLPTTRRWTRITPTSSWKRTR